MTKGDIVLMDTNVIIEAHRTKCWRAVVNAFKVETVEKCCEEAATGDKRRADYVVINVEAMKKSVLIHPVTLLELAELEPGWPSLTGLIPAKSICWRTP